MFGFIFTIKRYERDSHCVKKDNTAMRVIK